MKRLLAGLTLLLAGASPALAAGPATPRGVQLEIKTLLGQIGAPDLALVPTRLPLHFAFESYTVTGSPIGLEVSLSDQRFIKSPAQARAHEITFDTAYLAGGPAGCSSKSHATLRAAGTTVYSDGTSFWICTRASDGRLVKATARGKLAAAELAALAASARPVQ